MMKQFVHLIEKNPLPSRPDAFVWATGPTKNLCNKLDTKCGLNYVRSLSMSRRNWDLSVKKVILEQSRFLSPKSIAERTEARFCH